MGGKGKSFNEIRTPEAVVRPKKNVFIHHGYFE
jgi:hypothetical protein